MEPGTTNSFLERFLSVADSGFGLIQGDVSAVLNALIVISVVLAGAQWALGDEAPMAPFFRKVLFVGLFAFLLNNWDHLATVINQSGAMLGLKAGGGAMTIADLHNPGRIAQIGMDMFGKTSALGEGMNIITDFVPLITIYISAFFVMLGFFVLALQIFVVLIAFKVGSLAAFVALPWGVFSGTAWIAERPLGWVAASAMRLFVLAFVASVSITFVNSLPGAFTLDAGGALQILFFGLTMLALAWFAPQLASEVVQGQPHLAAPAAASGAAALAAGGFGAAYASKQTYVAIASSARVIGSGAAAAGRSFSNWRSNRNNDGDGGSPPRPAIDYAAMKPRSAAPAQTPPAPPKPPFSGGTSA